MRGPEPLPDFFQAALGLIAPGSQGGGRTTVQIFYLKQHPSEGAEGGRDLIPELRRQTCPQRMGKDAQTPHFPVHFVDQVNKFFPLVH